jgi:hypothetical protein
MPKIWEHRDPSTFIETEGLSGLGDEMVHSATITPSTTVAPDLSPDLSSGPVVIVQRPPKPKPDATSVAQQVASYEFSFVMNALCPWSSQVTAKYNALMNNPNLNASSKQVLGNRARQCLESVAKPSVTAPMTRPLTGPSATIAAALARAQTQAALAAAAAAAGKATTQAISKLKTSSVSVSTAPAGGVSAAAKELAAKNQALREKLAKGAVEEATKVRSLEEMQKSGAAVEAEIAALKASGKSIYEGVAPSPSRVQANAIDKELSKIGQPSVNFADMKVLTDINSKLGKEAGMSPLKPDEAAKAITAFRKSSVSFGAGWESLVNLSTGPIEKELKQQLQPVVMKIAAARILDLGDAAILGKNFGEKLRGATVEGSKVREIGEQVEDYANKGRKEIFDWFGLNAPKPKNEWEEMKLYTRMANNVQLLTTAGDLSTEWSAKKATNMLAQDKINGPAKVNAKDVIKNMLDSFSAALRNPGLRGTSWEVLNTRSDEAVRLQAGRELAKALNNFLIPQAEKILGTQAKELAAAVVEGIPKDVLEMQRERADVLTRMKQINDRISALDRGWGEDPTLNIAELKSQYRLEKKNADALANRIEQVTADPRLSKYAYSQGLITSMISQGR